jgi:hypothetical protein
VTEAKNKGPCVAPATSCCWWIRKLPETPDEWREKVSPVITFPRLIAKSWSAFSKSRVIFKKPTAAKKAESFSKRRRRLFGAKNRQMSQL